MLIQLILLSGVAGGAVVTWRKHQEQTGSLVPSSPPATESLASSMPLTKTISVKRLFQNLKIALLGDERQQQQRHLDSSQADHIDKLKQQSSRRLWLYAGATGLAILGASYPIFWWFGAGAVIYLARDIFKFIWRDIQRKHYFSIYWFSLVLVLGMIASGHLVLAAFSGVVGSFLLRIIRTVEDDAQTQLTRVFAWHPTQVWIEQDGVELQVVFESLKRGDVVIVNAGEVIPVDGEIVRGQGMVDQQVLTGESQPIERAAGEQVCAATLLLNGRLAVRVEKAADETIAANIAKVLDNTKSYKENLIARGQKVADSFLPLQVGLGAVTWGVAGATPALAMLWSGLGSNMAFLGPLSLLNYLHILSRQGILVKDGRVFESLRQVNTVIFDKTGTLTQEQPTVGQIYVLAHYDEATVLRYTAAAEFRQPHPVAKAILTKADSLGLVLPAVEEANYEVGYGILVKVEGHFIRVGSERFMQQQQLVIPATAATINEQAEEVGYSLIYVAIDDQVAGVLEMRPSIRPEARPVIEFLTQRGIRCYIISGDHEPPTRHLASQVGIEYYFAEVLPENKANLVQQLREEGRFVCFIGDGINDAIALKAAQVSMSLKGASSVATDTAQIIFMDGTLEHLPTLFKLSDEFEETMKTNLASSLVPGTLNIASIVFLHTGLAVSMTIYYLGAVTGMGVSLLPLIKHQEKLAELPVSVEK